MGDIGRMNETAGALKAAHSSGLMGRRRRLLPSISFDALLGLDAKSD